jgi:hypothetical protein
MTADRDRDKFLTIPDPGHLDSERQSRVAERVGVSCRRAAPKTKPRIAPGLRLQQPYFGQGTADLVSAFSSG